MSKNTDVIEPTPEMLSLLLYLNTRNGPVYIRPEQIAIAETCNPKWIAFGFGNVAKITEEGRAIAVKFGDAAHVNKPLALTLQRMNERQARLKAQETVNTIVARMVERTYPVEATNKNGHKPDYIPCDSHGGWSSDKISPFTGVSYFEENLARVLIGGWHSKAALIQLMIEIRRYTAEQV